MKRKQDVDLPLGDGKAKVAQTRGFSHWWSARDEGLTVKVESHVSITCGQSKKEVQEAFEKAGLIAEKEAFTALDEMDTHLESFMEGKERR